MRRRVTIYAILLLAGAAVYWPLGCSAGGGASDLDDDDSSTQTGTGNIFDDAGTGGTLFDGGAGGSGAGCSEASKFVYVIDQNNSFYKFDPTIPNVSAFQLVGVLNCTLGEQPNSMSVSREGYAYVLSGRSNITYPDGFECQAVNQVDILTANCLNPTAFQCGASGFNKFGMGYATDSASTTAETLFLGSSSDANFGSLDVASGVVTPRGTLPNQGPEFTGNANGELWGFFPYDSPPRVVQIDKTNGAPLQSLTLSTLPDVNSGMMAAWAFAYWGGSFYIFYMVDPFNLSTQVYKLEYDGSITNYIPDTGMVIVGAGVSTCAPIEPPR